MEFTYHNFWYMTHMTHIQVYYDKRPKIKNRRTLKRKGTLYITTLSEQLSSQEHNN